MTPAESFSEARYGLFVHFGLYSAIGRGEWVMNREEISPAEMREVAEEFDPAAFDAEEIADLAVTGGMKYLVFTTMHHEGFRLYHSELTDFCSMKLGPKRDFVAEIIRAARTRGLKVGLYHSLNNWFDQPDAVAALENNEAYEVFIENTFARIRELVTRYNPIDILWYDGWWPFDAKGWQAERMNAMVREIQPHILFNGRNGLPGDFATPEQHLAAPKPWRPWEACITLNDNWGFHAGDQNWKTPAQVIKMLTQVAQGRGNLLLNIGPRGDGSIPGRSVEIIHAVGRWLETHGECLWGTDLCTIDPYTRGDHAGDITHHGPFTRKGNNLYLILTSLPEDRLIVTGLECRVLAASILGADRVEFRQESGRLSVRTAGIEQSDGLPPVLKLECDRPPVIYKTGGMRIPSTPHPRYDPVPADIAW